MIRLALVCIAAAGLVAGWSAPARAAHPECSGAPPLPACAAGYTGPQCELSCAWAPECSYRYYCHADGDAYGMAAFGAVLFSASPSMGDAQIVSAFRNFVANNPSLVGFPDEVPEPMLEITAAPHFRHQAGSLTIFRFVQRQGGYRFLGSEHSLSVSIGPFGAIAWSGTIVDPTVEYTAEDPADQISEPLAVSAILYHASLLSGIPRTELTVGFASLVANRRAQAIGWSADVFEDGRRVGRVTVDALAGPTHPKNVRLLGWEHYLPDGLENTEQITATAEDHTTNVIQPPTDTAVYDELTNGLGLPLLGSTVGQDIQLGTERVAALRQGAGQSFAEFRISPNRYLSSDEIFDAMSPAADYLGQWIYVWSSNYLARLDPFMLNRWESTNDVLPDGGGPSLFPPGTLVPRLVVTLDATFCSTGNCTTSPERGTDAQAVEFRQGIPGGTEFNYEKLCVIGLSSTGLASDRKTTLAHEIGHYVDCHAAPGVAPVGVEDRCEAGLTPDGMPCPDPCAEDTTDEAKAMSETIANVFATWLGATEGGYGFSGFESCSWTSRLAANPLPMHTTYDDPATPLPMVEGCMDPPPNQFDPGDVINYLARPGDPACADYNCDKPITPEGAMTGDYTGWCDEQIGYQVYSVFQPLWELMHGMSCTPDPPFGCATVPGLPDLKDPVLEAVLYSVRMAPMTYQQLIDGISTRVACEYAGPDNPEIWEAYRSIVCHHGWIACDADPPTNCSTCGNNVRETGEQCDGGDFSGPTCADLEMSGELVGCDEDCHIVCVDAGTDSTAGSGGDGTATSIGSSSDTTIAPTSDTGGDGGGGGCGCRRAAGAPGALVLVLLWALRRRRWCEF